MGGDPVGEGLTLGGGGATGKELVGGGGISKGGGGESSGAEEYTATGTALSVVLPSPSCPFIFHPAKRCTGGDEYRP